MIRSLRTLAVAALAVAALAPAARAQLALGAEIPLADVKMKNVDGREVTIASVRGAKGTLVVFSCNACPWAQAWEARIVELGNAYARRGVGVIVVNPNDPAVVPEDGFDEMVKRAKKAKMAFPYVVDATSEVAKAFGATRTPEAFLFDAGGRLVYHGTIDDNAKQPAQVSKRYLRDALDAVVAGRAVPVAETKALGCTIKWRKAPAAS
uniref:Thioredoxin family protein n=1 Tax=Eiseniibacteriota bacterium TaxID=2212470 RepID=A0A832ML48_UNCEI